MMERLAILMTIFKTPRQARDMARRWHRAAQQSPELCADLVRLGGLFRVQPVDREDGVPRLDPFDPYRLAYDAGKRDLAAQLLAMMNLSISELTTLMGDRDE